MSDFTSALNFSGQSVPLPANPALRLSTAGSGLLAAQYKVDYNPAPSIPAVNEAFPPR